MAEKPTIQELRQAEVRRRQQQVIPGADIYRTDTNEAKMAMALGDNPLKNVDPTKTIQVLGPDGTVITRPGISDPNAPQQAYQPSQPEPQEAPLPAPEVKRDMMNPAIRFKQIKDKMMNSEDLSDDEMNFYDQYKQDPRSFDKLMGAMQNQNLKPNWGK